LESRKLLQYDLNDIKLLYVMCMLYSKSVGAGRPCQGNVNIDMKLYRSHFNIPICAKYSGSYFTKGIIS